jgi:hypothetical protein
MLTPTRILSILLSAALLFLAAPRPPQAQVARPDRATPGNTLVRVRYALTDTASADWSGRVEVAGGRLARLEGWHFPPLAGAAQSVPPGQRAPRSRITGADTWEAESISTTPPNSQVDLSPVLPWPQPVWPQGIVLFLAGGAETAVTVRFDKREPIRFTVAELQDGPRSFLSGAVDVERMPRAERVAGEAGEADRPSIARAGGGGFWVAWQEYRAGNDRILLRRSNGRAVEEAPVPVAETGDFYGTAVAEAGDGSVWVVWSAQDASRWHLRARAFRDGNGRAPEVLTEGAGPHLHHRLAADRKGRLWLVWQGFESGQSDIFLRIYEAGAWGPPLRVTASPENDWDPSIAVDGDGRAWIAWDTYRAAPGARAASYDVMARSVSGGKLGEVIPIAASARMEAHASVAVDGRGRPWIAYDEAGENWGKDFGFLVKDRGVGLYMSRAVRVVCVQGGRVLEPEQELAGGLYASLPTLVADDSGRIALVFRYLAGARTRTADLWGAGGGWESGVVSLEGGRWTRQRDLARSIGRNDIRAAAAFDSGELGVAYAGDHRPFLVGNVADYSVYLSRVGIGAPAGEPALRPRPEPAAIQLPTHAREPEDVRRLRSYRVRVGGREYRVLRGDLHRHTDISTDGIGDGSLLDLYRYALDAAAMDFIAVTDHGAGNDAEYSWWRTQKSNDLFFIPGAFTPLYGYERSLLYPNGHRNVVFDHRGVRTLPTSAEERQGKEGAAKLYRYLRENNGIAFTHTSATDQGTDWRDNDPVVEPLTEIYQGFRNSYEHEGAPKSAVGDRPYLWKSGYRPLGFYWNALAKGYKLGIQASSDHVSTHLSYACVITTGLSRREIVDAMRARRTYGATDNILLDVRLVEPGGAEHWMGESVTSSAAPRLRIHAVGTGPLARIDVVRNGRYVFSTEPGRAEYSTTYTDSESGTGESYYYVRVLQVDGQVAWGSPIWVTRR